MDKLKELNNIESDGIYENLYYYSLINLYSVLAISSVTLLFLLFVSTFLFECIKSRKAENKMNKDKNKERRKNYE